MSNRDLDSIVGKAEDLLRHYDQIKSLPIPATIDDALKHNWMKIPDDIVADIIEAYNPFERLADRKRVVRLEQAIEMLQEFEEALVEKLVLDRKQIFFRNLLRSERQMEFLEEHANEFQAAIQEIFRHYASIWAVITHGFGFLSGIIAAAVSGSAALWLAAVTQATSKEGLTLSAKKIIAARRLLEHKCRATALPQRHGRVRRRKAAR